MKIEKGKLIRHKQTLSSATIIFLSLYSLLNIY